MLDIFVSMKSRNDMRDPYPFAPLRLFPHHGPNGHQQRKNNLDRKSTSFRSTPREKFSAEFWLAWLRWLYPSLFQPKAGANLDVVFCLGLDHVSIPGGRNWGSQFSWTMFLRVGVREDWFPNGRFSGERTTAITCPKWRCCKQILCFIFRTQISDVSEIVFVSLNINRREEGRRNKKEKRNME